MKVNENFSSVSSTLDLKTLSSLTTVCGMSSRLVHVTVVPTATVSVAGPKLKLSIFTSALEACGCSARVAKVLELLADSDTARTIGARTKLHTLLLMTFLPLYFCKMKFRRRVVRRLRQRGIDHREGMLPADIVHVCNSQYAAQLLRRYFHWPRRIGLPWLRLRKRRGGRGMKSHIAFHLLHGLVNVPIQH